MPYVDGFIVAVPRKSGGLPQFGEEGRARSGASTARWNIANGSPTTSRSGKRTSFPRSVKLKPGETVIFSWITYKSRAQRDRVNRQGDGRQTAGGHDGYQIAASSTPSG